MTTHTILELNVKPSFRSKMVDQDFPSKLTIIGNGRPVKKLDIQTRFREARSKEGDRYLNNSVVLSNLFVYAVHRPHKHPGCTKHWSSLPVPALRGSPGDLATDYTNTYSRHVGAQPATAYRPPCRPRNPNPPPMDFRTVNRVEFKSHGQVAKLEPYKLKSELKSMSGNIEGKSVYQAEFPAHDVKPVNIRKGTKSAGYTGGVFHGQSTYGQIFSAKLPDPNPGYSELPSFTYSILYPGRGNSDDMKSHSQAIHADLKGAKSVKIEPPSSTIKLGHDDTHSLHTTHRQEFQAVDPSVRAKIVRPPAVLKPRPKFSGITQSHDDFKGFGGKMPTPAKPITPYPETICLRENQEFSFETTNRTEHRVTWDPATVQPERAKRPQEHYAAPVVKFDGKSMTHSDFLRYDAPRVGLSKPAPQISNKRVKFEAETSYQNQFPKYKNVQVARYGDFHESNTYLAPTRKFHKDGSVTQQDFKQTLGAKPSTPHKPLYNLHTNNGEFDDLTNYNDTFKPIQLKECTFPRVIAQLQGTGKVKVN